MVSLRHRDRDFRMRLVARAKAAGRAIAVTEDTPVMEGARRVRKDRAAEGMLMANLVDICGGSQAGAEEWRD